MEKNLLIEGIEEGLERIRPYLHADGGDIEFVELTDDMIVRVRLTGACHGCPLSMQTLKSGVEEMLKRHVPDIKEVVDVSMSGVEL